MSSEAVGWVWKHSPYKGAPLLVHLAIADVVNDIHGNEFWMSTETLRLKAKVSRTSVTDTLPDMVERGLLEKLESGGGRGITTRYRFLMETVRPALGIEETVQSAKEKPSETESRNRPPSARDTKRENPRGEPNARGPRLFIATEETARRARAEETLREDFAAWWKIYPRAVRKTDAWNAYEKARSAGASRSELVTAAQHYRAEREGEPVKYTLHPATFLREDRWRDHLEAEGDDEEPMSMYDRQRAEAQEQKRREREKAGRDGAAG